MRPVTGDAVLGQIETAGVQLQAAQHVGADVAGRFGMRIEQPEAVDMAVAVFEANQVTAGLQSPIMTIEGRRDIEAGDAHIRTGAQVALCAEQPAPDCRRWTDDLLWGYVGALCFGYAIYQGSVPDQKRLVPSR
jgi:hypothetical protein